MCSEKLSCSRGVGLFKIMLYKHYSVRRCITSVCVSTASSLSTILRVHTLPPHYNCSPRSQTIVSEPDTLPVKKSQKLLGGLLSSNVMDEALELCRTQMPLSLGLCGWEPLSCRPRLICRRSSEHVCLELPCLCSWSSCSSLWALEDWDRLIRLWWEWNCLILPMDLGGTSEERFLLVLRWRILRKTSLLRLPITDVSG